MSRAKALPNLLLRQSRENRRPLAPPELLRRVTAQKNWAGPKSHRASPVWLFQIKPSADNRRGNDAGSNGDPRNNTAGNKVYSNTGTDYSNRKGNIRRNSQDR